ncbi:hypothetical protein ABK040_003824 [Willaertia magna]
MSLPQHHRYHTSPTTYEEEKEAYFEYYDRTRSNESILEQNILSILFGFIFLFIGGYNVLNYIVFFSTFIPPSSNYNIILPYYIIDFSFYACMVICACLLFFSVLTSSNRWWKVHFFVMLFYSLFIVLSMILSITSITLSIVILARMNAPIGFTIERSIVLALLVLLFCCFLNCFFLPVKFRQTRREIASSNRDNGYEYNRL